MGDETTSGWGGFKNVMMGKTYDGEKIPLQFKGMFAGYRLEGPMLSKSLSSWRIAGAEAEFQHGADLGGRVTLTRVALTGVFALGLKKDRSKVYIAVQLPDGQQVLIEGKAREEKQARRFANQIQQAANHYRSKDQATAPTAAPDDPVEQIKKLAELRDAGVLTEDEFTAKKAEILGRM